MKRVEDIVKMGDMIWVKVLGVDERGIITALTGAIDGFAALVNAPRSNIASRAALNRELTTRVATRVATCTDHIRNVDDLILQLAGDGAAEFVSGWQQNRIIVDASGGPATPPPTILPAPPTPPTP